MLDPENKKQETDLIRLAFSVARTESEGPGWRFALWVQGCTLGCEDCCNPELWPESGGKLVSADELLNQLDHAIEAANRRDIRLEGVSLLGGEPYQQHTALALFAAGAKQRNLNVMVYSGYRLEEIHELNSPLTPHIDLLVAGRYQKDLHTTKRRWIGSENQKLHFLSGAYDPADPCFSKPNTAEIVLNQDGDLTVVGFPFESVRREFRKKLGHFDV